ncbi:MAG: hypothetical protein ACYDA1_06190 [Vulcanimicrobiaceae bacterium]
MTKEGAIPGGDGRASGPVRRGVIVCGSAPSSLGGSVAAAALADALDAFSPRLFSADPLGVFSRIYGSRVTTISEASEIPEDDGLAVVDYTGIGRLDIYRWPDESLSWFSRHGVAVIVLVHGATTRSWIEERAKIIGSRLLPLYYDGTKSIPMQHSIMAPILAASTYRTFDELALRPSILARWPTQEVTTLDRNRVVTWMREWSEIATRIEQIITPALPASKNEEPHD